MSYIEKQLAIKMLAKTEELEKLVNKALERIDELEAENDALRTRLMEYHEKYDAYYYRDTNELIDSGHLQCHCYKCNINRKTDNHLPWVLSTMILCPKCGNKRCPHATDHTNECTNSNEPNQPGSRY